MDVKKPIQIITKPLQSTSTTPGKEVGYAVSINDYLVSVNGLPNVPINEIVVTENNARGLVTSLKQDLVEILMLDDVKILPKQMFIRTNKSFAINVGTNLLGRTINSLGIPVDGKGKFTASSSQPVSIEQPVRGIKSREFIKIPFETGVTTVDMLMPLARGQRELVIGDARSGRTSFLIDLIVNQKKTGVICIYAMVGKPIGEIKRLVDVLGANKAMSYTIIVAASNSDMASLIFLAPSVAITIAEYFQKQGKDVLLVMDDLGSHAKFYREVSLLSNKAPGRESYPGDIFYQHAHLMERAGNFNKASGGGSITALPVIEINLDDYTAFIPTNLMSMTDGHLMFDAKIYHQGVRPAIDTSLSVTRVGRQTQILVQKLLADRVRSLLAQAQKIETLSRFGSEVSTQTQQLLKQQKQIQSILKQAPLTSVPVLIQMVLMALVFTPFFMAEGEAFVDKNKPKIISYLMTSPKLAALQKTLPKMTDDTVFIKEVQKLIPDLEKICHP